VKRALEEPMRKNAYNAGQEGAVVVGRVPDSKDDNLGFNAGTGEYMIKAVVPMLWTISIVFLSLWFLGVTIPYTVHGYIHLLLVLAVASGLIPFFHKRSAVGRERYCGDLWATIPV
jgi:hypothetical protein